MIHTKGVVHFTIPVTDIERSKAFYTTVFDMTVVATPPGLVFLKTGDDFVLLGKALGSPPLEKGATGVHHAFRVEPDEWDRAIAFLERKGIAIIATEDRKDGVFIGRSAYFNDPDGNILEVIDLRKIGTGGPPPR